MDKTGQVERHITPCTVCGQPCEALYNGEGYCMSCYIKKKYQSQPMPMKLASEHAIRSPE